MGGSRDFNPEELKRLYVDDGLPARALAARLGCGETTVYRRLAALGIARRPPGTVPGSRTDFSAWSAPLAYAVGLIATDGNLSRDGRHLTMTSADVDLLDTIRNCLGGQAAITTHRSSYGSRVNRIQWADRAFHEWLAAIGLMPAKSLRLGALQIPDEYFSDFLRGCIDGDGSILTYIDYYNAVKNPSYVYTRLFVTLASASRPFLEWVHGTLTRLIGLRRAVMTQVRSAPRHPISVLKYAKRDSITLLNWLYYAPDVPCLARKRIKAQPFLTER
ncbi:MAG: hypothetical protein KA764_22375 [Anaerolineales bacterium]|nr:hypothetical protein [Anaerolineales bacterium]